MNIFFKIVSWLGIVIVTIGAIISFITSWIDIWSSIQTGVNFGHYLASIFGIAGLILIIIGGIISKPKYFWLTSVIVGSFYIISFFSLYLDFPDRIHYKQIGYILDKLARTVLPGMIIIIEGIWLKKTANQGALK
jgi:hypothetical protein